MHSYGACVSIFMNSIKSDSELYNADWGEQRNEQLQAEQRRAGGWAAAKCCTSQYTLLSLQETRTNIPLHLSSHVGDQ